MQRPYGIMIMIACVGGCSPEKNSGGARQSYDAGAFLSGDLEPIVHTFTFSNNKSRVLRIRNVLKSCNCASATVDKHEVGPGEELAAEVKVNLAKGVGNWRVVATLETDDPETPDLTFDLFYRNYPRTRFSAGSIELGRLPDDNRDHPHIAHDGGLYFEINERVGSTGDSLKSLDAAPPITLRLDNAPEIAFIEKGLIKRSRYHFLVGCRPETAPSSSSGSHSTLILARTQGGLAATIAATWSQTRPIEVSPSKLSFGLVKRATEQVEKQIAFVIVSSRYRFLLISFPL